MGSETTLLTQADISGLTCNLTYEPHFAGRKSLM
jgi:hypothetical protein